MNHELLVKYLLGELTIEFIIAFYFFAIIGMLFTQLSHLYNRTRKEKKKGVKLKFNFMFWLKDNTIRFVTNILAVFLLLRFYEELPIDSELNMFLGLLAGIGIDLVIIMIRNLKITNIFGGKTTTE